VMKPFDLEKMGRSMLASMVDFPHSEEPIMSMIFPLCRLICGSIADFSFSAVDSSMAFSGNDRLGLNGQMSGWQGIIDVPRGHEYLYKQMAPMGGYGANNPHLCFNEKSGHEVELTVVRGKKKLKRVRKKKDEERKVTKDEALENPKKMFKYLKQ